MWIFSIFMAFFLFFSLLPSIELCWWLKCCYKHNFPRDQWTVSDSDPSSYRKTKLLFSPFLFFLFFLYLSLAGWLVNHLLPYRLQSTHINIEASVMLIKVGRHPTPPAPSLPLSAHHHHHPTPLIKEPRWLIPRHLSTVKPDSCVVSKVGVPPIQVPCIA